MCVEGGESTSAGFGFSRRGEVQSLVIEIFYKLMFRPTMNECTIPP
jgi:hypothetical protein